MSKFPTKTQISAGGVAYRRRNGRVQVALISVGTNPRWQLPKGLMDNGEKTEEAAQREVREETGLETTLEKLIDKIEYWYFATEKGSRVRYHKFVYFYLLKYVKGDVRNHDNEVNEARWYEIEKAAEVLAFDSEKKVVRKAVELLGAA
jgi:8-oxo-dGTP diphosphatase